MSKPARTVRIIAVPPGEAPLWVREKWVGLDLPVARYSGKSKFIALGILSSPRSMLAQWLAVFRGRAELIAGAKACIAETRKEAGYIAYDMHESVTDPSRMVFVEQWENAEVLVPHGKSDHMRAFGRVAVKCLSAPPKIEIITPAKVDLR